MQIIPSELKAFVEANPKLVTRKESKRYPGLFVLKYARDVFYKNLWHINPLLMECRGLVVDAGYNVIVKPFTKVFNYGENGTTIDRDETCQWVRKVNGFLGVATYDRSIKEDDLIYSTTGSLDSDFVDLIAKHVDPLKEAILENIVGSYKDRMTLMFEICDPTDPHIIPETFGAWLIGADLFSGNIPLMESSIDVVATMIGAMRPERGYAKFSDIKKMANECKHEGFMVYGLISKTALKIKSPFYLTTKFLARASQKKLFANLAGPREQVLKNFDEEFYPLIDYIRSISAMFECMTDQGRLELMREFLTKQQQ